MTDCRLCRQGFGLHMTWCPMSATQRPKASRPVTTHRKYWRPSRADRQPRADYVATVSTTDEHKRELARARQAQYRARRKAS